MASVAAVYEGSSPERKILYLVEPPEPPLSEDELLIEQRRAGRLVEGIFGSLRIPNLFSLDELLERAEAGLSTPLDLVSPVDWRTTDPATGVSYYRFGEEHLGAEF